MGFVEEGALTMGLTHGTRFINPQMFVIERFGAEAWEALISSLTAADQAALHEVVPSGWYDHALRARLVRRISGRFGASTAIDLGRYEADRDLTTVHRWFLRLVKPSFAIRNMNHYWCRSEDSGQWTSEVQGDVILAQLRDWDPVEPALCRTLQGYLARTLELLGGREVAISHPRCRAGTDSFCEFQTANFTSEPGVGWGDGAVTPDDLTGIAGELAHFTDIESVGEAIVEVLHRQLSFSRVALHVRTGCDQDIHLLRAAGRPGGGATRCFVLHAAGGILGRVDVDVEPRGSDCDALEKLLPCFALALRGAGASPRPALGGSISAERRAQALDVAARRWQLTPRQREVLDLLVLGMTNKQIAAEVGCQEGTVEVHVSQMLKKSHAGNRAGLAAKVWSDAS
jgi:DNA-binding CsgD family transcriptional regulator